MFKKLFHISRPVVSRKRKGGVTTTKRGLLFGWGAPEAPKKRRRRAARHR
jgi:hypothetical protein